MIDLDGLSEEDLELLLDDLAMKQRYVAFSGSKVLSKSGKVGQIATPLGFGPRVRGREVATVGAIYGMPGEDLGNPCCPHYANGTILEGAQDVVFQGRPVVMMGHKGSHWPVCESARAPAVVAEGWKLAYWAARKFTF